MMTNPGHNSQPVMIDGKMVHIRQIRNTDEGVLYSHSITVSMVASRRDIIRVYFVHGFCMRYLPVAVLFLCTTKTYFQYMCTPAVSLLTLFFHFHTPNFDRSEENQNDVQPS